MRRMKHSKWGGVSENYLAIAQELEAALKNK